jgi:hypothetical protein
LHGGKRFTLTVLVHELEAQGYGTDAKDFRTIVNTALWRRKDLFGKDEDGNFYLRTEDYELVD